jgi:hypothetical protein
VSGAERLVGHAGEHRLCSVWMVLMSATVRVGWPTADWLPLWVVVSAHAFDRYFGGRGRRRPSSQYRTSAVEQPPQLPPPARMEKGR